MTAEAARQLLALRPVDWRDDGQTLGEYLCGGAAYDEARGVLRFDLGWVTWRLRQIMHLVAAMKDVASTDALLHHAPTYDAWYETATFFVAPGRWGYVGSGPMFDVAKGGVRPGWHVGPEAPTEADVREWNRAGPLARAVRLVEGGAYLEIETVREGAFRCGIWQLPGEMRWTDDVLVTAAVADGGATLTFSEDGRAHDVAVQRLYDLRD